MFFYRGPRRIAVLWGVSKVAGELVSNYSQFHTPTGVVFAKTSWITVSPIFFSRLHVTKTLLLRTTFRTPRHRSKRKRDRVSHAIITQKLYLVNARREVENTVADKQHKYSTKPIANQLLNLTVFCFEILLKPIISSWLQRNLSICC